MGLDRTASKAALLLRCGYPFREDVAIPEEDHESNEPLQRGNRVHDAIDGGAAVPPEEQGYVDAARWWMSNYATHLQKEVAFDWDGETSTIIGHGRAAYINARPAAIMKGTADFVTDYTIGDWKTSDRSAAKATDQLKTLALMAGRSSVVAVELRANGTYVEHCVESYEPWDLDEHADALREAIANIPSATPNPGEHCGDHYCPLRGTCPAFVETVEAMAEVLIPEASLVRRPSAELPTTPEAAGRAYALTKVLEPWIKSVKIAIDSVVDANGGSVPLPDGRTLKRVTVQQMRTNADGALALCAELGASHEQLASLVTQGSYTKLQPVGKKQ